MRRGRWLAVLVPAWVLLVPVGAGATPTSGSIPLESSGCGWMLAEDFDLDGRDDLLVACASEGETGFSASPITIHRASATRSFTVLDAVDHPTGTLCQSFAAGDLDGNGRVDLVANCSGSTGGVFAWLRRDDGSSFWSAQQIAIPDSFSDDRACSQVAASDLDGDGRAELLVGCERLLVIARTPTNTAFAAPLVVGSDADYGTWNGCGGHVRVANVDGDASPDIVAYCGKSGLNPTSGLLVALRGSGGALDVRRVEFGNSSCGWPLVAGDVMGDARAELVTTCSTLGSRWGVVHAMTSSRTFTASRIGSTGPFTVRSIWASALCDGLSLATLRGYGTSGRAVALACPNFGNDGTALVYRAVASGAGPLVDLLRPSAPVSYQTCGASLAAGDFDGDGRDDLATTCTGNEYRPASRIVVAWGASAMRPSAAGDLLLGRAITDRISGGAGDDDIRGFGGADVLRGGPGYDTIDGGPGNDQLFGDGGHDTLRGGLGDDVLYAREGNGIRELVDCGAGRRDRAYVDRADLVRNCERVSRR